MRRLKLLLAALFALSMFAVSCGDDGNDDAGDDSGSDAGDSGGDATDTGDDVVFDYGVDGENKVIRVGLNADLSGPFASLVTEIVAAQEVYWEAFNEGGGYQGWTVEPVVIDSGYATDVGIQNYQEFAQESEDGVLMITENTGSPITAAIAEDAADDNMLVIPLSWASLWPDPEYGATILEKQTTYCIESMNGVAWLAEKVEADGDVPKLAIIGRPGEYGEDGSAGAELAAEALGIEIVYDGTGAVAGDDRTAVVASLVNSGANIVWVTLTPGELVDVFGNAVGQGVEAYWSGNSPSFNYLVHLGGDLADQFDQYYWQSYYQAPWATPGIERMEELVREMTTRRPDLNISDVYTTGWIEGIIAESLIRAAIDSGDLTRANMVEIATSGLEVDFGGLAASQSWTQDYNDSVVRSSWLYDVDAKAFNIIPMSEYSPDNPGSTGMIPVERDYVADFVAEATFDGPCIEPAS